MEHVDAAAGEAEDGLVVPLALGSLAVIVGAGGRVPEAGERGQEEGVLEAMVAVSAGHVAADRGAGLTRGRPEAGVGGEVGGGLEAADVADLDGDACPEAGADARQATQDGRLGEGEKSALDRRAELLASGDDAIELAGQLADEGGGRVGPWDGRGLGASGVEQPLSEKVGTLRAPGLQASREPLDPGAGQRRAARLLRQHGQGRSGVQPLAKRVFEGRPVRPDQGAQPVRQAIGVGAKIGVVATQ
jgi:hypothetical protein